MSDFEIEELLANLFERSARARRNPARHVATSDAVFSELPVAIAAGSTDLVTTPLWGQWILTDEVVDQFTNTTDADIDLDTHTSDSGHSWTSRLGAMNVSTSDQLVASSSAIYTVDRAVADMRVSLAYPEPGNYQVSMLWRYQDVSNYWRLDMGSGEVILKKTIAASTTTVATYTTPTADDDRLRVTTLGDALIVELNGTVLDIKDESQLTTATKCGVLLASTATAKLDSFHAWNLTASGINLETDPGHVFYGGPETWAS